MADEKFPLSFSEIDSVMKGTEKDMNDRAITSSVAQAVNVNPDEHAKVLNLSEKTGIAPDIVQRNQQQILERQKASDAEIQMMFHDTPEADKWLSNPDNAKLVSDDFTVLGKMKRWFGEVPEQFGAGVDETRVNNLYFSEMLGPLTPEEKIEAQALDKSLENVPQPYTSVGRTAIGGTARQIPQLYEQAKGFGAGGVLGAGTAFVAGQLGPQIALPEELITVPTGFLIGSRSGLAYQSFKQQAGSIRRDMMKVQNEQGQTLDPNVINGAAVVVGAANAGLDILPFEKLIETIPGVDKVGNILSKEGIRKAVKIPGVQAALYKVGKKLAAAGITEGGTEGVQQLLQIAGTEIAKEMSDAEFQPITFAEAATQTYDAAKAGLVIGTTLGAPGSAISLGQELRSRGVTPEQMVQQVETINQEVRQSKLFQRSPQRFHDLVVDLTGDEKFYVNAEAAKQVIDSLQPDQRETLYNSIPDLRDELETAAMTGADIALRKADYATFIAPFPAADQLKEHIKLDPADMSVAERTLYQKFIQENPEAAQQIQSQALVDPDLVPDENYKAVERLVSKAMQEAGRSAMEAKSIAPLFARTISRFAAPFGKSGAEALNENLLKFQQVNPEGQPISEGTNFDVMINDLLNSQNVRLDDAGKKALSQFGDALKQAGITPEKAKELGGEEVYKMLNPTSKSEGATLNQIEKVPLANGLETDVIVNPSPEQAKALVSKKGVVRAVADQNGNLYMWDAYDLTHSDVMTHYGIPDEEYGSASTLADPIQAGTMARIFAEDRKNGNKANQQELFQNMRGSITFANSKNYKEALKRVTIAFTEKANQSTAAHEFSHWAVATHRMFAEMAKEKMMAGDQNPELKRIVDDWETLKQEVGATSDDFTVEQEEKIASQFETYLREGQAPSEKLRTIFARFRDWLVQIYKDLKINGVEINPKISEVFDRWLASEYETDQVKQRNDSLTQIAVSLGLPGDIAQKISDYVNSAVVTAEDKIFRKLSAEQKKVETKAYDKEFASLREDVSAEFSKRREYNLINYMKTNNFKFQEGPETLGIDPEIVGGDVHPDVVADLFGYKDGKEMLADLKKAGLFGVAVDRETRRRLLGKYPDMIKQGRIHNEAVGAIMNERVLLALDLMIKEVGKIGGGKSRIGMKQFARSIAQDQVAKMKMADVGKMFRYDVARQKELQQALIASRKGDPQSAMIHLQRAMVNQTIFTSLQEFSEIRAKAEDLFKKVNSKDKDLASSRDIDFLGAARYILNKYGLGGEEFDIATWMADIQERDPDVLSDLVSLTDMISSPSKNPKELTVSDYLQIYNTVENIFSTARKMKEFQIGDQKIKTEQAVAELVSKLGERSKSPEIEGTQVYGMNKIYSKIMSLKAITRRVEHWISSMDSGFGGAYRKYIWEPISNASVEYRAARAKWQSGLNDILQKHKEYMQQEGKIDTGMIKANGQTLVMRDRLELIGFLLHTGNQSNLEKLLGGYGISAESFLMSMNAMQKDGRLTERDFQIVQELWDYAETLKGLSQRAHKKLYGYRFEEIENQPIQTAFGTFRGGYWPAVVDYEQVDSKNVERALQDAKNFMLASTNKGFTKSRVKGYKRQLSTDLRLASTHIDQVLRFAYLEPAVRQVSRLINNQDFKDSLKAVDPQAYSGMLMPWLQRAAAQITSTPIQNKGWAEVGRAAKFLRTSTSAQVMMGNIANAVQNFTGFSLSMYKVGGRNFAKALAQYIANPFAANEQVRNLSKAMAVRQTVLDTEITNEISEIVGRKGTYTKIKNAAIRHGYIFQRITQSMIDNVTWMAAFNKATSEEMTEADAVKYADSVVRETQSSGAPEDISDIEASSELAKPFLMFYSYFNNIANLFGTEAGTILREMGWKRATPKLFYLYMMTVAIPAATADLMVKALRDDLPGDDDDDGSILDDWLAWFAGSNARYMTASIPIAGQAFNAMMNSFNHKPLDDRISASPIVSMGDTLVRFISKEAQGKYNDLSQEVRDGLTAIGFATGLPLGQLGKPLGYIADVHEGDSRPEHPGQAVRGLLSGPTPKKQ